MDKRFWSGAVIVLTVVVAGAGALPGLLLRPAVEETPGTVEPAPFVPKPALAQSAKRAEPAQPAPPAALPGAIGLAPKPPASQPVAQAPEVQPQAAPTQATALPPVPQPQPVAAAPQPAFPPVQPIGADAPARHAVPTQSREASATRSGSAQAREQRSEKASRAVRQDVSKPKRHVRPAVYPLREFLAWRR